MVDVVQENRIAHPLELCLFLHVVKILYLSGVIVLFDYLLTYELSLDTDRIFLLLFRTTNNDSSVNKRSLLRLQQYQLPNRLFALVDSFVLVVLKCDD